MTRTHLLALATALTASLGAQAAAQSVNMTIRPESKVSLAGSSNVHDWACTSSSLNATIALDSGYQTHAFTSIERPITKVAVTIPVKSLKCGHGKMDENMYKALKAEQYPEITYVLGTYEVDPTKTGTDTFAARTTGELTVAGRSVTVQIPITAVRQDGGWMKGEGTARMKMTDFGIKPPVAMLGALRTRDEITVTFNVLLEKRVVVALTR